MLNKHNRNKMDPTRINNYNKFLSTLDQKANLNENDKNAIKILSEKLKEQKGEDLSVKDELDKIIDNLNFMEEILKLY
jgi:hypothetical protein